MLSQHFNKALIFSEEVNFLEEWAYRLKLKSQTDLEESTHL